MQSLIPIQASPSRSMLKEVDRRQRDQTMRLVGDHLVRDRVADQLSGAAELLMGAGSIVLTMSFVEDGVRQINPAAANRFGYMLDAFTSATADRVRNYIHAGS